MSAGGSEPFNAYHKWLGIPPKDQPPTHYRLLAIDEFESDADVIEHAADRMMSHVRQFQIGAHSGLSQQILNEIAVAKRCLLTPAAKTRYDDQLRAQSSVALPPQTAAQLPRPIGTPTRAVAVVSPVAPPPATPYFPSQLDGAFSSLSQPADFGTGLQSMPTPFGRHRPKKPGFPSWAIASAIGGFVAVALLVIAVVSSKFGANSTAKTVASNATSKASTADGLSKPDPTTNQNSGQQNAVLPADKPPEDNRPSPLADNSEPDIPELSNPAPQPELKLPFDQPIDILAAVDPQREAVAGIWTREGQAILSPPTLPACQDRLQFPMALPEEYRLSIDVMRDAQRDPQGATTLTLGLVSGDTRVLLVVHSGGKGGLALVDGKYQEANETTYSVRTLQNKERMNLECTVRRSRIVVEIDRQKVMDFQGDFSRLSAPPGWVARDHDRLFLGTQCCYRFDSIVVTPLGPN